jgi:hypothetical protein
MLDRLVVNGVEHSLDTDMTKDIFAHGTRFGKKKGTLLADPDHIDV